MLRPTQLEWARLFKEVLLVASRLTSSSDRKLEWTARDRAREATQRAFERYARVRPQGVEDLEALRRYLVGAMRSELGHALASEEARKKAEKAAVMELRTVGGGSLPSPEGIHLDAAAAGVERDRAARTVEALRAELDGDTIALGTIDCIAEGHTAPEEQARILGCEVEEIYNARKRRKRALERVLERPKREDDDKEGA